MSDMRVSENWVSSFFCNVSPKFLEQALDKKFMSDMRVSENRVSSIFFFFFFFGYVSSKFFDHALISDISFSILNIMKYCLNNIVIGYL